jgi:hypothetical protein
MPRVQPIPIDPAGNAVTNSLLARVLGRCPEVLDAFGAVDAAIRFHGRLPGELYEAVRRATAENIGCVYCSSLGKLEAPAPGPEQLRTSHAVAFAQMVAMDPAGISDVQFEVLREQFSDEEIVELVAFICLVGVAGQMFGAVMGLEAAGAEEAEGYQKILARQHAKHERSRAGAASGASGPA